jgi:hypothetical protein
MLDYVEGIKDVAIREIEKLDPTAKIRKTDYFNHSYAPDFDVTWSGKGRNKPTRPVFLRHSMRSAVVGHDVESLDDLGPVVLSLASEDDPEVLTQARQAVSTSSRTLLTDFGSIAEISMQREEEADNTFPLIDLVRGNVIRGGRGLLSQDVASKLTGQRTPGDEPIDEHARLEDFSEAVRDTFSGEAASRIDNALDLINVALGGEIALSAYQELQEISPNLAESDVRIVLRYLLRREEVGAIVESFWKYVASPLSLKAFEAMRTDFLELNLTPLVSAMSTSWVADRALLSYNLNMDETEELDRTGLPPTDGWYFHGKMLCLRVGHRLIHLNDDWRLLRGHSRDRSSHVRWPELAGLIGPLQVRTVALHGPGRTLDLGYTDISVNAATEVARLSEQFGSDFFVPRLQVTESEDSPVVTADFEEQMVSASPQAPISSLVRLSLRLLDGNSVDENELGGYL